MGWRIRVLGFESWQGLGIFLFTTMSRRVLGPIQPPILWVPGALSLGVKWPEREADHSPTSNAEVKQCVELYLHFPIRFHGTMLSLKKLNIMVSDYEWCFCRYRIKSSRGADLIIFMHFLNHTRTF
jgi:hypothetical protein